jgi:hypothetical protein
MIHATMVFHLVTIGFCFMQFDVIAHGILIGMIIHMLSYLEVVVPMNAIFFTMSDVMVFYYNVGFCY